METEMQNKSIDFVDFPIMVDILRNETASSHVHVNK